MSETSPVFAARSVGSPQANPLLRRPIRTNGRIWITITLWLFGLATCRDIYAVALTFPLFSIILHAISKIEGDSFGPSDMLWFTFLIFFVVAPCQSISANAFIHSGLVGITYQTSDFGRAMLIVVVSATCFFYPLLFLQRSRWARYARRPNIELAYWHSWILLAIAAVGIGGYVVFSGGLSNVLQARLFKNREDSSFVAFGFLACLCTATVLLAVLAGNPRKLFRGLQLWSLHVMALASAAMLLVAMNPFNAPRFQVIGSWLPVILAFLGRRLSHRTVYLLLLVGILVAMPIMSVTTRGGTETIRGLDSPAGDGRLFEIRNVDVFDTLVHSIGLIDQQGHKYGENISAIIFFFVPRSMWFEKPMVGGLVVGEDLARNFKTAGTDNLSYFVGGDLYMDFSYIGVALGFVFFAILWWLYLQRMPSYSGCDVPGYILAAFLPILLRGPLGAVVGYFCCMVVAQLLFRVGFAPIAKS